MHPLARLDHDHVWHPFTQMKDWLAREPVVIESGRGTVLRDVHGREYLDGNSSIWTNLHGHAHPRINRAIGDQLEKIAHSSALGLANAPASLLAGELVKAVNHPMPRDAAAPQPFLNKVFFSDDGSTAMEVALKLAFEHSRRVGQSVSPNFLSLDGAYHGDTVGAVSLGHIDLFHQSFSKLLFPTEKAMAPYCYRCPHNRAAPQRADARAYRQCQWECVDEVERKFADAAKRNAPVSAMVVEPVMQGAAGMIPQPRGWLRRVAQIARGHGALLVADEVMTGFGRVGEELSPSNPSLFGCHREGVIPDMMAVAKGLTGGYLPMAATFVPQTVFDSFLGEYGEFKTFFHGHSYTGNQTASAAALASLELLQDEACLSARQSLTRQLAAELEILWAQPCVGDIRREGLVVGVELVKDWKTRAPFDLRDRAGIRVCERMARNGVLTRPIGNVVVLMPPYCTQPEELSRMVAALRNAIAEELAPG